MQIVLSYDSSVNAGNFTNFAADGIASGIDEENAFKAAMTYVANELDSLFINKVTININVGWGEYGPSDSSTSLTGLTAPSCRE